MSSGIPVESRGFIVSSSGETLLIAVSGEFLVNVYKVVIYPATDISGDVRIKVGARIVSRPNSPRAGSMYGFNNHPNFVRGVFGDSLSIVLPSAATVAVDVDYRLVGKIPRI